MCCFFTIMILLGPRVANIIWWLVNPALWDRAFTSILWPILGIIFAPWTTLMYVLVSPAGVVGWDWLWVGLAVLADVGMYAGGGYQNRDRIPGV